MGSSSWDGRRVGRRILHAGGIQHILHGFVFVFGLNGLMGIILKVAEEQDLISFYRTFAGLSSMLAFWG